MLKKVLAAVIVLAAFLTVVDLVATSAAERAIADRARQVTGARSAGASLGPFPLLYHLFGQGEVPHASLDLSSVPVGVLRIHRLDVVLDQARVSRHRLLSTRQVDVLAVARADGTAVITASDLSDAIGYPVHILGPHHIEVDVAGQSIAASVGLVGRAELQIGASTLPVLDVDLGAEQFLSGCALNLDVLPGRLQLGCTMTPVPPSVLAGISGAAAS